MSNMYVKLPMQTYGTINSIIAVLIVCRLCICKHVRKLLAYVVSIRYDQNLIVVILILRYFCINCYIIWL